MVTAKKDTIGPEPTNDATSAILLSAPYNIEVTLEGTSALLFHRYSVESVAAKGAAAKNSAAKKSDDVDSYVYRDTDGSLCLPAEYVRMAMVNAAKYRQDPRSPRKSAMDLYKAAIIGLTELASLGVKDWDYLDQRRVVVQRSAISRQRPAMNAGWQASFMFMVNLPEYVSPHDFHAVLADAGRLVGVGDFRPSYGRFLIRSLTVL